MASGHAVTNICFHGIGAPGRPLEAGEERYWIRPHQYAAVLDEIAQWPAVAISFDDGNASDLELGLQPLVDRGMHASFFVLAGRINEPGSLSANGMRELRDAGMTIGSHGFAHRPWPGATDAELHRELVDARATIAEVIGTAVDHAALPLGRYDRRVISGLRRLGYARVYSSDRRVTTSDAWFQPRFSVRADDTPESLHAAVAASRRPPTRARNSVTGLVKRLR